MGINYVVDKAGIQNWQMAQSVSVMLHHPAIKQDFIGGNKNVINKTMAMLKIVMQITVWKNKILTQNMA
uniref:hypothetical protein n=1 Tax=Agathobacter sp. TaxID=2021311 RepID=UPI004056CAD3